MRKNQRARAPVLLCSSMDPGPLKKLADEHGAVAYVSKSAGRMEFVETVERALSRLREAQ